MIKNSKGDIYYGMHFYPGVAEYAEPGSEPYRVFLNEDTIRAMDPTFAGRPIFVEHVDGVASDLDDLRKDADGWVIESFYNAADGKHWAKFVIVSDRAKAAIRAGMRLSNAYLPKSFGNGGLWNGVTYAKEITGGEYEHLAIVKHPRYEESVILSPEEFKLYNENKLVELKRLANSKDQKEKSKMAFKFFKRTKVENSIDLEGMTVVLPKSGKEIEIAALVNAMDEIEEKKKNGMMADPSHEVKLHDGSVCNVGELLEKHKAMHDELESMKGKKPGVEEEKKDGMDDGEADPDKQMNDEDEAAKKKALELAEHEEKEIEAAKKKNATDEAAKKALAKEKAEKLANAHLKDKAVKNQQTVVEFSQDQVARGKARYGSN